MSGRRGLSWRCCLILAVLGAAAPLAAQTTRTQSDELSGFLEVRRRQVELREARQNVQRMEELGAEGLISEIELARAHTAVERAQYNYQEAVLSLLSLEPHISVVKAVKSQTREGRQYVDLVVSNLTPTFDDSQFQLLNNFEGANPIPEELRTRDVRDIFISLESPGGPGGVGGVAGQRTTIALPYEVHVPELPYGSSRRLRFQLLRDVDSVVVVASYKNQRQEIAIQLQQAETENIVRVTSDQISQEADLGGQAAFNLTFERSGVEVRSFPLRVLSLPRQISYSFLDPEGGARLSQISFPAGVTQRLLRLRLFLPEQAGEGFEMDRPLRFWALAMDPQESAAFEEERDYSAEEIASSRSGSVELELIPRGVGEIEVWAPSLFSEVRSGETFETRLTLRNKGTRRLDNIQLRAEPPVNWEVEISPRTIAALEINEETSARLTFAPPAGATVGDYEVRIKTESYAYNRPLPSDDKIYRIRVKSRASVWGTFSLVALLLIVVAGTVFLGIRLTRR